MKCLNVLLNLSIRAIWLRNFPPKRRASENLDPADPPDDLKPASGQIYLACKQTLSLAQPGNDAKTFMRDTLAPLIKPGMKVYEELKGDIFGLDGG